MYAKKAGFIKEISPREARDYMAQNYILLDENQSYLPDPLSYAKEQIKKLEEPKTIEIPIPDTTVIKQLRADMEYIAMLSDVEL